MADGTEFDPKREIDDSMVLSAFCMRRIGLSFESPKTMTSFLLQKLMFVASVCGICYHVFSEIVFIGLTLANSPRVEDVVPLFHTFGYGALSISKVFVLWYKMDVFKQLMGELATIWPAPPLDPEHQLIKDNSLSALRIAHRWYFFMNVAGVWFYNVTPIGVYLYALLMDQEATIGFVWVSWYPFDKHKPFAHFAVYLFEIFAGQTCVWIMVGTDLLFSGMASHIGMLLKLLQRRLEIVATTAKTDEDNYQEILENIKLHQRLIRYCNDLEVAFSLSNLVNIVLSSVNICCVVFVIVLLEPFLAVSNKLFLGSALIQVGMICWYADIIYYANADVAVAAYNSGWYRTNPRCRRALLFLIKRSQKPIAFTAMGFTDINLVTYSSILTRSYSYFALLYTMYSDN
ncbi:odorant receptor 4 isoform X1 [Amyelois transitella]|uniref:odorant receptor 4 isoform X1 n=2 Tax=Amyelois transitella TaxID=680683 RepID=UPI0029901F7F|nr:odorant receptor 4 isoform X1 [Amyelois transitella]